MKRIQYKNTMPYITTDRKGAKYLVGETYKNNGELLELIEIFNYGFDTPKRNLAFDKGSDIQELNASVKSSGASLACLYGETKEQIITEYFKRVVSTMWVWLEFNQETQIVTEYRMNKTEFKIFLEMFSVLATESGTHKNKVRFKRTNKKMLEWLESF